jgi:2-C-methyl-D-erythritol 4-phosphate cytidylyltransferase
MGARVGGRTPKQFLRLPAGPILLVTVAHFARHPAVDRVVVVAPPDHRHRAERLLAPLGRRRAVLVVPGGRERQESVWLGLQAVGSARWVVVHDAVRPFVTRALTDRVLVAARRHGAAICAVPVTETVKRVSGDFVEATVDRRGLWSVQTPQAFRADLLREAHDRARRDGFLGTDEAMLVERLGHPVRVVRGLEANVKITTPADLRRARTTARARRR